MTLSLSDDDIKSLISGVIEGLVNVPLTVHQKRNKSQKNRTFKGINRTFLKQNAKYLFKIKNSFYISLRYKKRC